MNKKPLTLLVLVIFALAVYFFYDNKTSQKVSVHSGPVVGYASSPTNGLYLTDKKGRTLYILSSDTKLKSGCSGECTKMWPVFEFADEDMSKFDDILSRKIKVIEREDGWFQYTYNDYPLHYYSGDRVPGAINGLFKENFGQLVKLQEADLPQ